MKYIDMHCDTVMTVPEKGSSDLLIDNKEVSIDFKRLKESNAMAQFFAIFLMKKFMQLFSKKKLRNDDEYIEHCINLIKGATENTDYMKLAYNYDDLIKNNKENKISAFLTIEDGRSADSLEKIKKYHDMGIRLITFTWNYENCMGYPNSNPKMREKGLKEFGLSAVEYMNELGMIVDVSHLSDGGFYDVYSTSKKPFVASHSNARELSPHTRNLTDDMIKKIAEKGGAIGLNFCPQFLDKNIKNKDSKIELMVNHLNHIKKTGGEDVLALGSDFDGISGKLEISGCEKMPLLFEALKKEGWTEAVIEKLAYKNMLRVIKDTL